MNPISQQKVDVLLDKLKNHKKLKKGEIQEIIWSLEHAEVLNDDRVIIELFNNETGRLRSEIIQVLGKSKSQEAESALIDVLETSNKYYELLWAAAGLANSGTNRALPALKSTLENARKETLRVRTFATIHKIAGEAYKHFYVECLNNPKFREKYAIMSAIRTYCGPEALDSVIKRLMKIIGKSKSGIGVTSEITDAMDYLYRYRGLDKRINKICKKLNINWDKLTTLEQNYLQQRHNVFSEKNVRDDLDTFKFIQPDEQDKVTNLKKLKWDNEK